jgi:plastocyanin
MKRLGVVVMLAAALMLPVAVAAQYYPDDEPTGGGGGQGGDMNVGGSQGGGITVGGGDIQVGGGAMGGDDEAGAGAVSIIDFAYQPAAVFVGVGSTVEWTNDGAVSHTVDANAGQFESGEIGPGGGYSYTFDDSGVYSYHCDFHPNMHGTVIVTG